jgi:hypothetical protein
MSENPRSMISRFRSFMFDDGVFEAIITHIRNIITSSLIVAAGVWAVERGERTHFGGLIDESGPGMFVAAIGMLLFLLNMLDGLHRLLKSRRNNVWAYVLVIAYVLVTFRLGQVVLNSWS